MIKLAYYLLKVVVTIQPSCIKLRAYTVCHEENDVCNRIIRTYHTIVVVNFTAGSGEVLIGVRNTKYEDIAYVIIVPRQHSALQVE